MFVKESAVAGGAILLGQDVVAVVGLPVEHARLAGAAHALPARAGHRQALVLQRAEDAAAGWHGDGAIRTGAHHLHRGVLLGRLGAWSEPLQAQGAGPPVRAGGLDGREQGFRSARVDVGGLARLLQPFVQRYPAYLVLRIQVDLLRVSPEFVEEGHGGGVAAAVHELPGRALGGGLAHHRQVPPVGGGQIDGHHPGGLPAKLANDHRLLCGRHDLPEC
jgi:hypothetical protein